VTRVFTDWGFWIAVLGVVLWVAPRTYSRWRARSSSEPPARAADPDTAPRRARHDRAGGVSVHLVIALIGLAATLGLGVGAATVRPRSNAQVPARQEARPPEPATELAEAMSGDAPMPVVHEALMARHDALTRRLDDVVVALNSPGVIVANDELGAVVTAIVHHRLTVGRHLVKGMAPPLPLVRGHEGMRPPPSGPGEAWSGDPQPGCDPPPVSDSVHPPA